MLDVRRKWCLPWRRASIRPVVSKLFLSCASAEFSHLREMLIADLRWPNVEVKAHAEVAAFNSGETTLEKLDTYIDDTDLPVASAQRGFATARSELDTALATLRQANIAVFMVPILLPSAWLHALAGEWEMAQQRLDEAFVLATCGGRPENGWVGGMRLHLVDTLLHRARLFRRRKAEGGWWNPPTEYPWPACTARMDLDEAAALIDACGYHRRDAELADARAALA
jgi:hypothetical protein